MTTGVALARLGMDSAGWLVQRTALSVFLVCLAGWTRYHPPARDVALSAEEERQKLEADASNPTRIVTVRGHGYRLVPNDAT